jgi:hypothetical protein
LGQQWQHFYILGQLGSHNPLMPLPCHIPGELGNTCCLASQ